MKDEAILNEQIDIIQVFSSRKEELEIGKQIAANLLTRSKEEAVGNPQTSQDLRI